MVEQHKTFLRGMVKIGFLHFTNAPAETSQKALPTDIDPPLQYQRDRTIIFFHDESTFSANDDQNIMWVVKGQKVIKPKCKGAGIMVSDFIEEKNDAREFLEYGEGMDGYWNRDKFIH